MKATKLSIGDIVKLNDSGIKSTSGFVTSRREAEMLLGPLTVSGVFPLVVTGSNGRIIQGFQAVDIKEFPVSLDNMQVELWSPKKT